MRRRKFSEYPARAVLIAGLLLLPLLAPAAPEPEKLAVLDYRRLPEASGIAVSPSDEQRLWFINDSGNRSELIVFHTAERRFSTVNILKTRNRDWEDLAAFEYRGAPWLAIADVGDNGGTRKKVFIYLLPEPRPDETRVSIHSRIELRYPDKPRDVESMAVDSQTGTLYLLSKRESSPRLYRVALPELVEGEEYELLAEKLGKVKSIPEPSEALKALFGEKGKYLRQPTAMTLLPDGSAIAVMTYGGAYLARLGPDRDWLRALNESLCPVATPLLAQAESIGADSEGRLYVTSEGRDAPLLRIAAECRTPAY